MVAGAGQGGFRVAHKILLVANADAGDYAGYNAWMAENPGPHAIPLYDSEGAGIAS